MAGLPVFLKAAMIAAGLYIFFGLLGAFIAYGIGYFYLPALIVLLIGFSTTPTPLTKTVGMHFSALFWVA